MSCKDACVTAYDSDYSSTAFSSEKMPRAAKQHRCEECGAAIAKGDIHHYASGKTDDSFWSARTCLPCDEIRKTFVCGGWVIGSLWEDIRDQLFPSWNFTTSIDCLARLKTEPAMAKMRNKYAEFQKDQS